jgi:hypothetical protein
VIPVPRISLLGNTRGQKDIRIKYRYFRVRLLKLEINKKLLKNINKFLKIKKISEVRNKFVNNFMLLPNRQFCHLSHNPAIIPGIQKMTSGWVFTQQNFAG